MNPPPTWLACLQTLAASETVRLEALGHDALDDLLARGLIEKDERPKQVSLESRYEALQETHRHILEARACAERLHRRMAPRSRFAGLLGVGTPPVPGPEDPDLTRLMTLMEALKIQVRGVRDLDQIPAHLDRIQDHIQVEGRDCLDRLADTDREIDALQKQAPPGTQVESAGFFTLTRAGEAALPEAPVMEAFEGALQAAFGPLTHRSASSPHVREDPASFLTYLLEGMARGERPSSLLADYERLLEAFDRVAQFSDLRSLRAKIGFLVRLLRASRDEPKRPYLWCNRERLNALAARIRPLVPSSVAASGWHLPYAVDLFLADGGLGGEEGQAEGRTHLFEAVHRVQSELLQDTRIADGQFVRLALTLAHAARVRQFTPGLLMDRFLRRAYQTVLAAAQEAPYQLGDRGTRLLFGAHLAHAAGFTEAGLTDSLAGFRALHERLGDDGHGATLPVQAQLHAFATLGRLERLGAPVPLEAYAGLLARLRKRLRHHKVVIRAFRTEQAMAEDEEGLIANLAARTCFEGLAVPLGAKRFPDAGMAGLYEGREVGLPPLLGSPFGTLMLG